MYTNGLFENLKRQNIECCIGPNFVGIIGYADDLFLMSPTLDGLQKMLQVCEHYAKDHNVRFSTNSNPKKSVEVGNMTYHPIPNNEVWRINLG